ncbi:J domain-containing protein [Luteolibacter yonseiensis]|uniref:J domain-containing protein n=1 Tax=Luteolibacter yonseiensis TaxID=1144680 RepID=A0A934R432_9BACT|nr:J domain-containing protein [Luteolibacter yonseiensis]MBK1816507.1 J domain-containing protein [Luteolibacter yonseiensis]
MGLPEDATADEIKTRYKDLSKSMHPDRGGSADAFSELTAARDAALTSRQP